MTTIWTGHHVLLSQPARDALARAGFTIGDPDRARHRHVGTASSADHVIALRLGDDGPRRDAIVEWCERVGCIGTVVTIQGTTWHVEEVGCSHDEDEVRRFRDIAILAPVVRHRLEEMRHSGDDPAPPLATAHAAARWADVVMRVVDAADDPKTLVLWGKHAAASPGTIRNWCRTASLKPKASLDFARMLRAVLRRRPWSRPEDLLDVVDRRTLGKMMRMGSSCKRPSPDWPRDPEEFLAIQEWITEPRALNEIRARMRRLRTQGPASAAVRSAS